MYNPIKVELSYPRIEGKHNCIDIDLLDVRASDGIRVMYDFDRDGWVIMQPRVTHPRESDNSYGYHEEWIETAFVQSYPFGTDPVFIEEEEK
jgi:hypothetical protein